MKNAMLKAVPFAALIGVLAGCGANDGLDDLADGKAAFAERNFKKAATLFSDSLAVAPTNVETLVYMALTKLTLGELTDAKSIIDRAASIAGGDEDVLTLSGQIAWHLKDYPAAYAAFEKLAVSGKYDATTKSAGWTGLGIVEMSQDKIDAARVAFMKAINLDRRNASAYYHLARLYRDSLGYNDAALDEFKNFAYLAPADDERTQKVKDSYIPELTDLIAREKAAHSPVGKRNSDICADQLAKAEAQFKKHNYKTARGCYEEAYKADPLSYAAALGLARVWQKIDATNAGQKRAFEYYKTACKLNPSAISTYNTTGELAAKLGYHAVAVNLFSRAVAANPKSYDAIDGLIRAHCRTQSKDGIAAAKLYQDYRDSITQKK
jgi:Tfp pilus assembly protein PilF